MGIKFSKIVGAEAPAPVPTKKAIANFFSGPPVTDSKDLARILAVPRRQITVTDDAMAVKWTALLSRARPECTCHDRYGFCIKSLNAAQGHALEEANKADGLLAPIGVGHGKCLSGDTEVFDLATGRRRALHEKEGPLSVASTLRSGCIEPKQATCFYSGEKECVRLALANGATIKASTDHRILTANGWVEAGKITHGQLVATPRNLPDPQTLLNATADEIRLAALLMADGGLNGPMARFTNMTPAVIAEFCRLSYLCGGYSEQKSNSKAREFSLLGAKSFRDKWFLYGLAKEKRLAPCFWGMSAEQCSEFLNYFWACDGHVSKQAVECTLASEGLIDDLVFLGLRLGVRFRKSYTSKKLNGRDFDAWRVSAYGADAFRFLTCVGPVLGKEEQCLSLLNSLSGKHRNTNHDIVPISRAEAKEMALELNLSKSEIRSFLGASYGQYVSRRQFVRFCEKYNYNGKYRHLAENDIAWERVKTNTPVGKLPVYDLHVPETHNFVANNIVVHNTGIDILLPMVMNCRRAVLLIPANLRHQFLTRDYPQWSEHFRTPNIAGDGIFDPSRPVLHVLSYNELSQAKNSDILARIQPDLIIADEAHNLKAKDRARTKRFLRQFAAMPGTRFVALSGTMTTRSIRDYAHLSGLALKEATPLPVHFPTLESWATALDAVELPAPPGALEALCQPGEDVRSGFRRRLVETRGVVATEEASVGCSLVISERKIKPPKDIADKLKFIRDQEARPDGEELIDQIQVAAVARQMACGFFYRWQFRKGETPEQIEHWLDVRSKWRKELRNKLKTGSVGTDSEALLQAAASRWHEGYAHEGKEYPLHCKSGPLPVWASLHYLDWCRVRGTVEPHTVPVWVDDYLLQDAMEWAKTHTGIIWYQHRAVGYRLAQLSGMPHYGSGEEANAGIAQEKGDRTIIASIKAHGVGKNLQAFNDQLIVSPPSDAALWEQCLDSETEILTDSGWATIDENVEQSKVAAFNPETKQITFEAPVNVTKRILGEEQMYGICNPQLDIRVTAGHRMLVITKKHVAKRKYEKQPLEFITAENVPRTCFVPVCGEASYVGVPLSDTQLVFLGMFLTDGNLEPSGRVSLFQSTRYPSLVQMYGSIIPALGFTARETVNVNPSNFGPRKHPLHKWNIAKKCLVPIADYLDKTFSHPAFEQITRDQLLWLLLGMWSGDGYKTQGTYSYDKHTPQTMRLCSKRKCVVERLQRLCVSRGLSASIAFSCNRLWQLSVSETSEKSIHRKPSDNRPVWGVLPSTPDERVWCVSVSTGAIVIRRNGKVCIVGNCLGRTHRQGQKADEVLCDVYRHTPEMAAAVDGAIMRARYIYETTGSKQRLLYASTTFDLTPPAQRA